MHVLIATDGSKQSLEAARYLRGFADPASVSKVAVVAVVSPLAAVPFAGDVSGTESVDEMSFRRAAEIATQTVATELDGWGPAITTHVYGGSPASEIVKAATRFKSGLVVVSSHSSSRTQAVLMGSVSQKVLHSAPCPVLVHRPGQKPKRRSSKAKPKG